MRQTPQAVSTSGDVARLVDIGGRDIYIECAGEGSPTVNFEAGYRSPATVWTDDLAQPDAPRLMAQPAVAKLTRACAYERPGVAAVLDGMLYPSRSDPVPMPRDIQGVVTDLHALLVAADIVGPYVMVGHSLGGLMVRLFTATYPDDVVGMVLVDAWYEGLESLLTPEEWAAYVRLNSALPPELAGYTDYETIDFADASATMRRAAESSPLRPMPLVVLSHGQPFGLDEAALGFSPDALERAWATAQAELASLTPDARHIVAERSGHYIQLDEPELVIDTIRQVVEAVRDPATWSASA
jgi:pimeloyl-ACP methyl ester carboxylesterase